MCKIYLTNEDATAPKMWYQKPGVFNMDEKKAARMGVMAAEKIQFRLRSNRVETTLLFIAPPQDPNHLN
jgi:hypothetical protein